MKKNNDILKDLFSRMPEEELPASFRVNVMQKVMIEAERIRKRNERIEWFALIIASLFFIGLAIIAFSYLNISFELKWTSFSMPDLKLLPFYSLIGTTVLILLGIDHKFRQIYKKKHEKEV